MPRSARVVIASSSSREKVAPLTGALDLGQAATAGGDDVHVHLGAGVLVVGEIEQDLAIDHAHRDGGDGVPQRNAIQCSTAHQAREGQ